VVCFLTIRALFNKVDQAGALLAARLILLEVFTEESKHVRQFADKYNDPWDMLGGGIR
jgi:hypothetical protein